MAARHGRIHKKKPAVSRPWRSIRSERKTFSDQLHDAGVSRSVANNLAIAAAVQVGASGRPAPTKADLTRLSPKLFTDSVGRTYHDIVPRTGGWSSVVTDFLNTKISSLDKGTKLFWVAMPVADPESGTIATPLEGDLIRVEGITSENKWQVVESMGTHSRHSRATGWVVLKQLRPLVLARPPA